jgi:hypothetical protein
VAVKVSVLMTSLKITVKWIGLSVVGSACPAAWLRLTAGPSKSVSKAPISQAAPCGRAMPRWSVGMSQGPGPAASMARESITRAWVWVGPP